MAVSPDAPAADDPGRTESEAERDDRNMAELLQELRVAGLGVQVLFGFLLSLPFSVRFVKLSHTQRDVYIASLLLAALSTALLCGPVAFHRLVFRRHEKGRLLRVANVMALLGLGTVGLAISAAVLLVISFVERGAPVPIIASATIVCFGGLWFAFPLVARRQRPGPEAEDLRR
jgi:ABC-type Fe3+ transport system permease subunit